MNWWKLILIALALTGCVSNSDVIDNDVTDRCIGNYAREIGHFPYIITPNETDYSLAWETCAYLHVLRDS